MSRPIAVLTSPSMSRYIQYTRASSGSLNSAQMLRTAFRMAFSLLSMSSVASSAGWIGTVVGQPAAQLASAGAGLPAPPDHGRPVHRPRQLVHQPQTHAGA